MQVCAVCDEFIVDDEGTRCASCDKICHAACLSEEGDDGQLCAGCGTMCPHCNMTICARKTESNHLVNGRCPDLPPPPAVDHKPQVCNLFTAEEAAMLRARLESLVHGQVGVFGVDGLERVARWIKARVDKMLGCVCYIDTFKWRNRPKWADGVGPHTDLDYILRHVQNPHLCICCGKALTQAQKEHQRGLHMRKRCRGVPDVARVFTVAGNLGPDPVAFLEFGPPCAVGRKRDGTIVPVMHKQEDMVPCILSPGDVVVFSSHVLHQSSLMGLSDDRYSFDMRGQGAQE